MGPWSSIRPTLARLPAVRLFVMSTFPLFSGVSPLCLLAPRLTFGECDRYHEASPTERPPIRIAFADILSLLRETVRICIQHRDAKFPQNLKTRKRERCKDMGTGDAAVRRNSRVSGPSLL